MVLPSLACASIDDELLAHSLVDEVLYFANGQRRTLKIPTREHPETCSLEPHEEQDDHTDFDNLPEPQPIGASAPQ